MYSDTNHKNRFASSWREDVQGRLIELLSHRDAMQAIVDYAYNVLEQHPVFVMDTAGNLLAWSSQADYTDPVLRNQIETGRLDRTTYEAFRNDKRFEDLFTRRRPVLYKVDDADSRAGIASLPGGILVAAIRIGDAIVGYLVAFGTQKAFPDHSEDKTQLILSAVSIEMQKSDFLSNTRGSAYEALLNKMLEGRLGEPDSVRSELAALGRPLLDDLYVIVFTGQETHSTTFMRSSTQGMLRGFFPGTTTVAYERCVVMLASTKRGVRLPLESPELLAYLVASGIIAGVSGPFTEVDEVRRYYQLALKAAQLGMRYSPGKRIHTHASQAVNHLLSCVEDAADLRSFCIPELLRLWESGKPADREMLESFFCYLRHMKGVTPASAELHVHRNTLVYRTNRIAEIAHLDPNNGTDVEHALLTEDILRYLELA